MAEVLNVPRQPDGQSYYQSTGLRRSPPSSSSLFLDASPPSSLDTSPQLSDDTAHIEREEPTLPRTPSSLLPPAARSPSTVSDIVSDDSSVEGSESLESATTLDTELDFPNYDDAAGGRGAAKPELDVARSSSAIISESSEGSVDTDTTRSDSPLPTPTVADDTALKEEPSRQVDFLSHDWREEDIWSSWRHIVSQRKTVYGERSRLENASWRSWAKHKFDLRTVSPERLNWLKESDVTWLYGPLKTASSYPVSKNVSEPGSQLSKNNSFVCKKPILKKRSMSEVMLQKSISTSSLVKQAADRIQAQGRYSRRSASHSDAVDSKFQSETPSRDQMDYFTSRSSSTGGSPGEQHEKRHIRFDERVEQCIAIDCKDPGLDLDEESENEEEQPQNEGSDSSSDDGVIMMKRTKRLNKPRTDRTNGSRSNSTSGRKIIETLPSTTLKYRTDSPDVTAEAQHHTFGRSWSGGKLSPSPSQETLRPTRPSSNFLIPDDDEDDEDVDSDSSWSFGASNPKSSLGRSSTPGPGEYEQGMRRTNSGMLMPADDEYEAAAGGILGRVNETINTARDIAHVIWNVGWRSG